MMKLNQLLMAASTALGLCVWAGSAAAQPGPGGGRDPAQFRQQMMDRMKETLEVKDDKEWQVLEPLIQKVTDARMAGMGGMGRGMFGRRGGPGGDANAQGDQGGRRRGGFGGQPNPDAEALQKAIDAKASSSELKAAIAKFQESRKAKQKELETAQDSLRKVLTTRQEAIATSMGLL